MYVNSFRICYKNTLSCFIILYKCCQIKSLNIKDKHQILNILYYVPQCPVTCLIVYKAGSHFDFF